jgi:phage pi2 protein 07
MEEIITIPKEITKRGDLVLISRKEYEELLKLRKKRNWEERDTDEAINIFKREKREKKLRLLKSLADLD